MTTSADFLSTLNHFQRRAVEHFCGPLLVIAGAGSGKTRALTYRIANLIIYNKVNPGSILAVTFTNKAAKEMKDRLDNLLAQEISLKNYRQSFDSLSEFNQKKLLSFIYKKTTKQLWIGTFHSLCARILRYDINKYQDSKKRKWDRNFSIFDESDVQNIVKNITLKQFNLDEKTFNPRTIRYAISSAKNLGLSPEEYLKEHSYSKGRIIAEIYDEYQTQLAENNALDFDDLILIPVRLFEKNQSVLGYWHSQFKHILVDEYQDTNRIQYTLIQLLTTNGKIDRNEWSWRNRSVFVVGDADQSIYSFRMADFTILLNFQSEFGDGLSDEETKTMIKLENNYRSTETILSAANHLIYNNSQRIDKTLKATRGKGEKIYCYKADNEHIEAEFVINKIEELISLNPKLSWKDIAFLYRVNSQSRPFEDILVRRNIPYTIVGGFKFYDRQEIKDSIAYLRLIVNPYDTVSLLRVINSPRRGIGKTTVDLLLKASQELRTSLWEILIDETCVMTLTGKSSKAVLSFVHMIKELQEQSTKSLSTDIFNQIMQKSGYINDLKQKETEEADNRLENLQELYNAINQYREENNDPSLQGYLTNASLSSDLDNLENENNKVSLMTLHSAKGLEFPIVFLVGLEQGTLPHIRSLSDPLSLEEERRLCYVGITRAQEKLFITYAQERFVWGSKEIKIVSQFLEEIPQDLVSDHTNIIIEKTSQKRNNSKNNNIQWSVGDHIIHYSFGEGEVTHVLGSEKKVNLAIKFKSLGRKIIDPGTNSITKILK
ncbi:DNA helicase PcrA [Candidatus Atelocyanobacterium thalassae]|uniref:ATP-dependent DNA helicase n=1 Tax=cyanobacterium endosymbiont of Braarudosphaera bigelowii TaxID=1285375 RepID=A0ABN6JZC6_9CHRO|nr:DNA helicase PcrA [Candidatus Atelocyanobacterium thalassa]BDA39594.1 ATP-dependent DNA helicase PcrA [cyanobacterium endosymbiont of Braarudosphaera bigelowii]